MVATISRNDLLGKSSSFLAQGIGRTLTTASPSHGVVMQHCPPDFEKSTPLPVTPRTSFQPPSP
eukprot:4662887-Amphidinium_carterae.1